MTSSRSELRTIADIRRALVARFDEILEEPTVDEEDLARKSQTMTALIDWCDRNLEATLDEYREEKARVERLVAAGLAATPEADDPVLPARGADADAPVPVRLELIEAATFYGWYQVALAGDVLDRRGWTVADPIAFRWWSRMQRRPTAQMIEELADLVTNHADEVAEILRRRKIEDNASASSDEALRPALAETPTDEGVR